VARLSTILAIDPGTTESGWCLFDGARVLDSGVHGNPALLSRLWDSRFLAEPGTLAIEMMRARGMPVSNDEMRTLVWIGRFQQAWCDPEAVRLVYRGDVKMHVCGNMKANDSNIRAGLIELLGPPGKKAAPGPTYGVASHAWAALGVAVTCAAATVPNPKAQIHNPEFFGYDEAF
jgi:hypothetical protein